MLKFWHGSLPVGYQFSFEPALYNTPVHRQLQSNGFWESFYLLDEAEMEVRASIHFHVKEEIAASPFLAPFGGIESHMDLPDKDLLNFLRLASDELIKLGVKKIKIKQCPGFEDEKVSEGIFLKAGFSEQLIELDSFIHVNENYELKLQPRKSRKLRSLKKSNLVKEQLTLNHLKEVYSFISHARREKNYSLSMSFAQLNNLAAAFPERVYLFSVKENEKLVAASICLRVKKDWLYDFYHDHDAAYDAESPVVLLMDLIYEFCNKNAIQWIELGTSMSGDQVNEGLLAFKGRLGAKTVKKISFEKTLTS